MFFKRAKKSEAPAVSAAIATPQPAVPTHQPLDAEKLRRSTAAGKLGFKTTADVTGSPEPFEAKRVQDALRLIFSGKSTGRYPHIYVAAPRQSCAVACVTAQLTALPAAMDAAASDWISVCSAQASDGFTPISLAAGEGKRFADGVRAVVNELRATLPYLLTGEDYLARRASIEAGFAAVRDDAFARLRAMADAQNVAILTTPMGYAVAPTHEGKVVKLDVLNRLPDTMRSEVRRKVESVEAELQTLLADVPTEAKSRAAELAELTGDYVRPALSAAFSGLVKEFSGSLAASAFLNAVQAEVLRVACRGPEAAIPDFIGPLVSAAGKDGKAPIVVSEETELLDALVRAGKGAVIIDADRVFAAPGGWPALKGVLAGRGIALPQMGSGTIPFAGTVVLVGHPDLADRLDATDADFATLVPQRAAFAAEAARSEETEVSLARSLAHAAFARGLLPLDAAAVAHVIGESARVAGRPDRLSGDLAPALAIITEASRQATLAGRSTVTEADVEAAYVERRQRARVQALFSAAGPAIAGRVVALGLAQEPVEVWATVRCGHGRAADIARAGPAGDANAAAALLWSYLAGRYVPQAQLAFAAAIVHEPLLDGQAAALTSAAELYALLSTLAERPIADTSAVAGWASASGALLPLAGINSAIEAAFDHASPRDASNPLTIVMPRANESDLMLRADLVEAARKGRLRIFTAATVEEGFSILTGLPAGERTAGTYAEGSFNRLIEDRLLAFARQAPSEPATSPAASRAAIKAPAS